METLRLIVRDSEQKSTTYVLEKDNVTVGRGSDNDVLLDHPSVSRHHIRIERDGTRWQVVDLESTNGTSIKGVTLTPYEPHPWRSREELKVGDFLLGIHSIEVVDAPTQVELTEAEQEALRRSRSALAAISLNPPTSEVVIGETTSVMIPIRNSKPYAQTYDVQLGQIPSGWSTLSDWRVTIEPNMHHVVQLTFHPSRDGMVSPGKHTYEVTVRETDGPIVGVKRGELVVRAVEKFSVQLLTPEPIRDGQQIVVRVTNLGDTPGIYQLVQPTGQVVFTSPYETILLQAGVWNDMAFLVRSRNRPIFGRIQNIPFALKVANQKQSIESIETQLQVRPIVPLWLVLLLLLLIIAFVVFQLVGA